MEPALASLDITVLLAGTLIFTVGSIAIYAVGDHEGAFGAHTLTHVAVPMIAASAYLAMALGIGTLMHDGRPLFAARYADWAFTTPLLLAGLIMIGLHEHTRNWGLLVLVLVLDALMIVTGFFSAWAEGSAKWAWYAWSCGLFAAVLLLMWGPVRSAARAGGGRLAEIYGTNLVWLTAAWLIYPVVFAFGPEGTGAIPLTTTLAIILVLDVVAKVVYGISTSLRLKALSQRKRAQSEREDGRRAAA